MRNLSRACLGTRSWCADPKTTGNPIFHCDFREVAVGKRPHALILNVPQPSAMASPRRFTGFHRCRNPACQHRNWPPYCLRYFYTASLANPGYRVATWGSDMPVHHSRPFALPNGTDESALFPCRRYRLSRETTLPSPPLPHPTGSARGGRHGCVLRLAICRRRLLSSGHLLPKHPLSTIAT